MTLSVKKERHISGFFALWRALDETTGGGEAV
jgi:hypothetical protein